jgi:hypothetical protein
VNSKRLLGDALRIVGTPSAFGLMGFVSGLSSEDGNLRIGNLLWAVPLSLTTLPLLPLYFLGDKLLKQVEEEEFSQRTKGLLTIDLPEHYLWITNVENEWRVEPFFMNGEEDAFESEVEARLFVETLQYKEVLSKDCQSRQTFWIKNDSQIGPKEF